MRVTPKTEAQIAEANLISDGEYMYCVMNAEEQVSKGGNDMIKLSLNIFDDGGDVVARLFDYLIDIDSMAYKLRHFSEASGFIAQYESGDLPASDMVGATGKCKIGSQPAKDGYPAKNTVKDYVKRVGGEVKEAAKPAAPKKGSAPVSADIDDDIPFAAEFR